MEHRKRSFGSFHNYCRKRGKEVIRKKEKLYNKGNKQKRESKARTRTSDCTSGIPFLVATGKRKTE